MKPLDVRLRYSRAMSDEATEKALVDRLNDRLPRVLELKERVDRGARMSDADIAFLKEMVDDAGAPAAPACSFFAHDFRERGCGLL